MADNRKEESQVHVDHAEPDNWQTKHVEGITNATLMLHFPHNLVIFPLSNHPKSTLHLNTASLFHTVHDSLAKPFAYLEHSLF